MREQQEWSKHTPEQFQKLSERHEHLKKLAAEKDLQDGGGAQAGGASQPLNAAGPATLPHVCPCGAVRVGDVWTPKREAEALPPRPHSHGMCPACVAKYRAEREQLRRLETEIPTPRTDEHYSEPHSQIDDMYFARQLERELAEVKSSETKLRNEIDNIITHLEVHNERSGVLRSPHMDVLHALQQRDQWREMAERLAKVLDDTIIPILPHLQDEHFAAVAAFEKLKGESK